MNSKKTERNKARSCAITAKAISAPPNWKSHSSTAFPIRIHFPVDSSCRVHRAFTIIEIVVFLAIVLVLAVMFLGGIPDLLKRSTVAGCSAKLRNLGAVINAYAIEHHGRYPEWVEDPNSANRDAQLGKGKQWDAQLLIYLNKGSKNVATEYTAGLFFCPGSKKHETLGRNARSYIMNQHICRNDNDSGSIYTLQQKHRVLLLVDGADSENKAMPLGTHGINNLMFYNGTGANDWTARHIPYAERHGGVANVLFADGHVEATRPRSKTDPRPRGVLVRNP